MFIYKMSGTSEAYIISLTLECDMYLFISSIKKSVVLIWSGFYEDMFEKYFILSLMVKG